VAVRGDEEDQQTHVAGNDSVRAGVRPTVSGDDWANAVSAGAVSVSAVGEIALARRMRKEEDPIHGQGLEVPPPLARLG
jgi:hypothetical protein